MFLLIHWVFVQEAQIAVNVHEIPNPRSSDWRKVSKLAYINVKRKYLSHMLRWVCTPGTVHGSGM